MTIAAPSIANFDPLSREYLLDPLAAVQHLFEEAPVFYSEPFNAYFVLPYDEVRRVLDDYETYSSHALRAMPVRAELRDRIPEEWERAGEVIQDSQLGNTDPPVHTRQRRAIQRTFTHKRVGAAKADIAAVANELIDELDPRGSCDVVHDFAAQLTLRVAGGMLNIPPELLPGFHAWIEDVFRTLAPIDQKADDVTTPDDQLVSTYEKIYGAYVTYSKFIEQRQANPGEDLASAILSLMDDDGRPVFSNDQVLGQMLGLTAAGTDTTAALIASMVRLFTESPDQLQLVLEHPSLWDNAVREGLRRSAVATQMVRISTSESELAGVRIPAGSKVCASLASANGDPAKFPNPLSFDVRRANAADHLGFGHGRHHCLGAPLAAPEARIALETLYRRLPDLKADLDQELDFVPLLTSRMVVSQRVSWAA
jgi:cytochrome P450